MLPFDADRLDSMLPTWAEPNSVGMSPIGGFIDPVYAENDWGLCAEIGGDGQRIRAPLSRATFAGHEGVSGELPSTKRVHSTVRCDCSDAIGIMACKREIASSPQSRDGPRMLDVEASCVGQWERV